MATIRDLLARCRLVTISGTAGVGKSRLAAELARAVSGVGAACEAPPVVASMIGGDGTWMVELSQLREEDHVAPTVLAELRGLSWDSDADATRELAGILGERRVLLILDNCEHVLKGCANLAFSLFRHCSRLRILATSRQPLGISGEGVWVLQPLATPGPAELDTAALAAVESVDLFLQRARDVVPDFSLENAVVPVVAEICRRLDGLPLAIELAAARLVVLSPREILDRMTDRFHLLSGGTGREARHQAVKAALDWSHDLLSDPEALALRRLSVFAGSWTLLAAEQVIPGEDGLDILDLTAALFERSWVVVDRMGDRTRFRLLDTIRDYARAEFDASSEADAVSGRHAAWYAALAEEANAGHARSLQEAWLRRLDDEEENFRSALAWACDRPDAEIALRLAAALSWFWLKRGKLEEGQAWLRSALSISSEMSPGRARALGCAGQLAYLLGDPDGALDMIDNSVALFRRLGERGEALGPSCLDVFNMCRNPLRALPVLEANLDHARTLNEPNRLAHAFANLGMTRFFVGDPCGARGCFEEVLELGEAGVAGDALDRSLMGLARVALFTGNYNEVSPPLIDVLGHAERLGDRDAMSGALSLLAALATRQGDIVKARQLLGQSLELAQDGGSALSIGRCELLLGQLEFAEGVDESAGALFAQALRRLPEAPVHVYHQIRCLLGLADVAAAGGNEAAASLYAQAYKLAQASGDEQAVGRVFVGRSESAGAAGNLERALTLRHRALEVEERTGDRPALTSSLEALAALAVESGRSRKGARLFGAAARSRERHAFARPLRMQSAYDHVVAQGRAGMGPEAWDAAWRQGRSLSLTDAVAQAHRGRGPRERPVTGWESLTRAERDVVELVAGGVTNGEAGRRLLISARTVQSHLAHIYVKLGICSRQELILEALRRSDQSTATPARFQTR